MRAILFLAIWGFAALLSAGYTNANLRAISSRTLDCPTARQHLGFSVVMGMVGGPISLVVSLAISGFGVDGWTLSSEPSENQPSCREYRASLRNL